MLFKTIPEQLFTRDRPKIRVINQSAEVFEISLGQPPKRLPLKVGDTLYEGPANVFGGSTTPCYGYNLVAFPFARMREGFMNFRIVRAGVVELLANARKIFTGKYQADSFKDYLLTAASVEIDRPIPFQIGGDPAGKRDRWDLEVSDLSVHVLDLTA
jgi:diacylglycerol kinase family enzyme